MQGWSEARVLAYLQKDCNPNAYFYRFNERGEAQGTGEWTDAEKGVVRCCCFVFCRPASVHGCVPQQCCSLKL